MVSPALVLNFSAEGLSARDVEGARVGNKGRHKMVSGQQAYAAIQQHSENEGPVQICSVVQGLQAVVKENRSLSWAEEGEAGEEKSKALDRHDFSATVSKGKAKGKSLQSSK